MKKEPEVFTFASPENLARFLAEKVLNLIKDAVIAGSEFHIALSGGSTPRVLFEIIADNYSDPGIWDQVRFYWADERCVPPDHPESNYRMAYHTFLRYLAHSNDYVFRIYGEEDPHLEAERYGEILRQNVPMKNGLPEFDLVLLGMGGDGHTASIFPEQMELLWTDRLCDVGIHPGSGQRRITMTGKVINNAKNVFFLVTGEDKARTIADIICRNRKSENYPASHIDPVHGKLTWFLDSGSGSILNKMESKPGS